VFGCSFGCLERVDLLRDFFYFLFEMTGCGTVSRKPLAGGIRIDFTVLTRSKLHNFIASITFVNDDMTTASIESTTLLGHEGTFRTDFDALTNHCCRIPFLRFIYNNKCFFKKLV
jgi:hypothetical protein